MYSRNIGVLSRCVSFTLGEWEKEISPRGEVMERSSVYGEIEEFTEFLPVRVPKMGGAFVVESPVYLHASMRRQLDGVAMPVPHRSTEPARPRHRREMRCTRRRAG